MSFKVGNIAKNTSYFTLALVGQKIISFVYFALLARYLGPEDLGKYYFAISFTTIFAIFVDLGISNVLTREIAKKENSLLANNYDSKNHKELAQNILSTVLSLKIPLAFLSFLVVFFLINIMKYSNLTKHLVYISSVSMILDSFTLSFFAILRGFHNLKFESIASFVFQLIVLGGGLTLMQKGAGLRSLISVLVLASLFNFLYSFLLVRKKFGIKIKPVFNYQAARSLFLLSIPFAVFAIFQRIYTYFDSVLLSLLAGDKYVGLYQVAFKIVFALQFLPMAFIASLYPAFAAYWSFNREQLAITFERAINYLIVISLPIMIGVVALSDKIVIIFKQDFNQSILLLRISMLSLLFIFLNFPIGALLNACDKQHINTRNMGITLVFSIILNLILIPFYQNNFNNGAIGASITVVLSNFLMFVFGMYWVPKIIKYNALKILKVFIKSCLSAFIIGILTFYLKEFLNILIVILISGAFYFFLLFIFQVFNKEDVVSIIKSFSLKKS